MSQNPQTLTELLSRRCAQGGVALIDRDHPVTADELADQSMRVAQGLWDAGVREGDRVALWLPNVPAWLSCFFACARLGAIVVAVNTRFRSGEISDILNRSGAKVLIYWPGFKHIDFDGILRDARVSELKALKAIIAYGEDEQGPIQSPHEHLPIQRFADLLACEPYKKDHARAELGCLIFTTSGTTKLPKFVLHSQASMASHATEAARAFEFDKEGACTLLTVPMCGTFGMSHALSPLAAGRLLIFIPTFEVATAAAAIERYQVTHFPATGDIVAQLRQYSKKPIPYPSVRMVTGVRAGQARLADARGILMIGIYGSSEMQAILSRQPSEATPEQREIGGGKMITQASRVRVCDTVSGKVLPHGEQGEIQFKGPSCMMGYFGNPEATQEAFTQDGYFKSGDLGYTVDDSTYVYLSRMGDVLRLSGFLVNPLEIESLLDAHDSVSVSQVVGVEGARGLIPVAFVTLKPGCTLDEETLKDHCAKQIAKFKVPHHIFAIDAFPFTPSANGNKIQKAKLREIATASLKVS